MDSISRNQIADPTTQRFHLHLGSAVSRLANRLNEVTHLVKLLDSSSTPARYRQALRTFVEREDLTALALGLLHLSSPELWDAAHAQEFVTPELAQRLTELGVPIGDDIVRP